MYDQLLLFRFLTMFLGSYTVTKLKKAIDGMTQPNSKSLSLTELSSLFVVIFVDYFDRF